MPLPIYIDQLSKAKKIIALVFIIWLAQAIPKWSAAIMADDETSSKIMQMFIEPKYATMDKQTTTQKHTQTALEDCAPNTPPIITC